MEFNAAYATLDEVRRLDEEWRKQQDNDNIRKLFDDASKEVADLERLYRDLGIKFFILPVDDRAAWLEDSLDEAKALFIHPADGGPPRVVRLLYSLRTLLNEIRGHIHRFRFQDLRDAAYATANNKLEQVDKRFTKAATCLSDICYSMGSVYQRSADPMPRILFAEALELPGAGLPTSAADDRYADFYRWALTVREVQNDVVEFGLSEGEAMACLTAAVAQDEDEPMPDEDVLNPVSSTSYFESDSDAESSTPSNPYEDPEDQLPAFLRGIG